MSVELPKFVVVDASVVAKRYLPEELSEEAEEVLEAGVRGGLRLGTPGMLAAELGDVLWHRCRRGGLNLEAVRQAWAAFDAAPIAFFATRKLVLPALEVATTYGCTVYDALYVALAAAREEATVLTADRRLSNRLAESPFSSGVRLLEARTG